MNPVFALILDPARIDSDADIRPITADPAILQRLLGGTTETVHGYRHPDTTASQTNPDHPRITFYLHREANTHGRPVNPVATALWWYYNPAAAAALHPLCGPVIVTGHSPDGTDTDIPEDALDTYTALCELTNG
jgi:hypothetical protein